MQCRMCVETVRLGMSCEVHSSTAGLTCQKKCDARMGCPRGCISAAQAALLVLTATATWARVVASDFGTGLHLGGLDHLHQAFNRLPGAPQRRHLRGVWTAVHEEALIARTEIVQTCLPVWSLDDAIFRAASVTHSPDFAFPTIAR